MNGESTHCPLDPYDIGHNAGEEDPKAGQAELHHVEAHHPAPVFILYLVLEQGVAQGHSGRLPYPHEEDEARSHRPG